MVLVVPRAHTRLHDQVTYGLQALDDEVEIGVNSTTASAESAASQGGTSIVRVTRLTGDKQGSNFWSTLNNATGYNDHKEATIFPNPVRSVGQVTEQKIINSMFLW